MGTKNPAKTSPSKSPSLPQPVKIPCPNCNTTTNLVRAGKRRTNQGNRQIYYCKKCKKYFSDAKLRYQHYRPKVILNAITYYNTGHTLDETRRLVNRRYKTKVPLTTLHSWIKRYRGVCNFTKLRKRYRIDPENIIFEKRFEHQQVYEFKYHRLKLNIAAKTFPRLRTYVRSILKDCPDKAFQKGPRCSTFRLDMKPKRTRKHNNAQDLTALALNLARNNRERHDSQEQSLRSYPIFILYNCRISTDRLMPLV